MLPNRDFESSVSFVYYSLISILVTYCMYSGGLIFSRRDDSLMTQVPAKISEKTAFQLLYSLIIVPMIVMLLWYALNFIGGLFIENGDMECAIKKVIKIKYGFEITASMKIATFINSACQTATVILTMLLVVIKSKKYRLMKGLLTPVIILLFLGIVSGIYGFVAAITGYEQLPLNDNHELFVDRVVNEITTIAIFVDIILTIYCIFVCYCIYRHNKMHQVA